MKLNVKEHSCEYFVNTYISDILWLQNTLSINGIDFTNHSDSKELDYAAQCYVASKMISDTNTS